MNNAIIIYVRHCGISYLLLHFVMRPVKILIWFYLITYFFFFFVSCLSFYLFTFVACLLVPPTDNLDQWPDSIWTDCNLIPIFQKSSIRHISSFFGNCLLIQLHIFSWFISVSGYCTLIFMLFCIHFIYLILYLFCSEYNK